MPDTADSSRQSLGCVVFLVDLSPSMQEPAADSSATKAEIVAGVVARVFAELAERCGGTTGGVGHSFDVALIGYTTGTGGGPAVESLFARPLPGWPRVGITGPLRDRLDGVTFHVGLGNGTRPSLVDAALWLIDMCLPRQRFDHLHRPPALVIHITGSDPRDGDPASASQERRAFRMSLVRVCHCTIAVRGGRPILFPHDPQQLRQEYDRLLFRTASPLSESERMAAGRAGLSPASGAVSLASEVGPADLWAFLRVCVLDALPVGTTPTRPGPAEPPPRIDENVRFAVYRPQVVRPGEWYTMLAFAHLAERPDDAPPDEPDPEEQVRRQVKQVLGDRAKDYEPFTRDARQGIPRGGELTFVPEADGVEFNPPARRFLWQEAVHREEFRLRSAARLDGQAVKGRMTVFLGGILVADVPLTLRVDGGFRPTPAADLEPGGEARRYRKIFASYSHQDLEVVRQFEAFVRTLGDEYLRDWTHLRAGEVWNDRLMELIREADVFQLFWSWNAMRSAFVRQEWEFALSLNRPNFVRPTYWEEPMPTADGLPPSDLTRIQFQRLHAEPTPPAATHTRPAGGAPPVVPRHTPDMGAAERTAPPPQSEPSDGFVRFTCPSCGKRLKAPGRWAGRSTSCSQCGHRITLPDVRVEPHPTARPAEVPVLSAGRPHPRPEWWNAPPPSRAVPHAPRRAARPWLLVAAVAVVLGFGILAWLSPRPDPTDSGPRGQTAPTERTTAPPPEVAPPPREVNR